MIQRASSAGSSRISSGHTNTGLPRTPKSHDPLLESKKSSGAVPVPALLRILGALLSLSAPTVSTPLPHH
jgi:hypothetical protein